MNDDEGYSIKGDEGYSINRGCNPRYWSIQVKVSVQKKNWLDILLLEAHTTGSDKISKYI